MVLSKQAGRDRNENDLLDEISEKVDIGKPTIKECYNKVYHYRESLLPEYLRSSQSK
jgi:hypothetical protein